MSKKVAIIYSGGLDSLVTAHLYHSLQYEVTLIHYLYGQYAQNFELEYTKKYANYIKARLEIIDAKKIFEPFSELSTLLSKERNEDELREAESDSNYVPMRNLILISYSAAICEKLGINKLAYGANVTESGNYPDNSVRFFENIKSTLKTSGKQNFKLEFRAPLINLTKTEIVKLGYYFDAPFELSLSCYYPTEDGRHCGKCGSCLLRINAFKRAGIIDPAMDSIDNETKDLKYIDKLQLKEEVEELLKCIEI